MFWKKRRPTEPVSELDALSLVKHECHKSDWCHGNVSTASAEEVALALEAKRREVNDRTQTGTGITFKKSAIQSRL